jgi:hypothetical protein
MMRRRLRVGAFGERAFGQYEGKYCQFCSEPIPVQHSHVLDAVQCAIWCACAACSAAFHFSTQQQTGARGSAAFERVATGTG